MMNYTLSLILENCGSDTSYSLFWNGVNLTFGTWRNYKTFDDLPSCWVDY